MSHSIYDQQKPSTLSAADFAGRNDTSADQVVASHLMILKNPGNDETLQRCARQELQRWSDHPLVKAYQKQEIEKQKHEAGSI